MPPRLSARRSALPMGYTRRHRIRHRAFDYIGKATGLGIMSHIEDIILLYRENHYLRSYAQFELRGRVRCWGEAAVEGAIRRPRAEEEKNLRRHGQRLRRPVRVFAPRIGARDVEA